MAEEDDTSRKITNPYWYKNMEKYGVKVNGREAFTVASSSIDAVQIVTALLVLH